MKKLILALTIIALIFGAVSCNGDVDEALFGNDFHYYEVQDDGSWVCSRNDCDHVLEGTEENKDYILVLNSKGQPGTVYPLETNNDLGLTVSGTTYTLNSDKALTYYLRTSSGTLLVNTPNADVHRYGTIDEVVIYKVKNSSYHEFGTVKDIAILDGHLSLGPTAKVDDLAVAKGKTGTESVSFDFDENAEVKIFAIYNNQLDSVTVNGKAVSSIESKTEIAREVVEIPADKEARKGIALFDTVEAALSDTGNNAVKIVNDILENKKTISVESGKTLVLSINVELTNIQGSGSDVGELDNKGTLINFGEISNREGTTLSVSGATAEVKNYNTITNESGATVKVEEGAKVSNESGAKVKNEGDVQIDEKSSLEIVSGATLDNQGTLTNNGTVSNSGTVKGEIGGTGTIEASEDASFDTDPEYVAQIFNGETAGKKYTTLEAAVKAAVSGSTIKLLNNVTLDNSIVIDKNITLDLNTKTIECSTYSFNISGDVVFTGNGTIHKNSYNGDISVGNNIQYNMINISGGSNVVVENGNYISKWPQVFTVNNSKLTFNSGVVKTDNSEQFIEKPFDTKSLILVDGEEAVINLYGGEFDSKSWHGEYLGLYGIFLKNGATLNAGKEGTTGPVIDSYYSAISSNGEYAPMTVNIFSGLFKSNLDYADAEEDMNVIGIYAQKNSRTLVNIYGGSFKQTAVNNNAHIFGIRYTASKTVNIFSGEFICKDTIFSFKEGSANNDIVITGGTYSSDPSAYVADGYCAVEDSSEDGMWSIGSLFAGGDGTKDNPWLITDYETMQNISKCVTYDIGPRISQNGSKIVNSEFHYWKVKDGIKEIDCQELNGTWIPVNLYGSFDGNGVTFKNLDNFLFFNVGDPAITEEITIENFKVICDISFNESYKAAAAVARNVCHNLTLKDINIQGRIMGTFGTASFFAYGPGNFTSISGADAYNVEEYKSNIANWKFINCISSADLYDFQGGTSGFFVNAIIPGTTINSYGNGKDTLLIEDSGWFGTGTHSPSYTGYGSADSTAYIQVQNSDAFMAHTTFKYSQDFIDTYGVALQSSGLPDYSVGTFEYKDSGESDKHIYKFRVNDKTRVAILDIQTISAEENSELVISKAENAVEVFVSLCLQSGKNAMVNVITTREHTWSTDNSWNSGITNYKYTGEVGDIFADLLLEKTEPEDLTSTWVQVVQLDENGLPVYVGRTAAIKYNK